MVEEIKQTAIIEDRDPDQATHSETFDPADVAAWKKHLAEEGFVVLRNVLPQADVEKARGLVFDWFEGLNTGIKRDDVSTWHRENWPGVHGLGFLCTRGGGQSEANWYVRSHPEVVKTFKEIWKTEQDPDPAMLTSMDTFICWRPWESDKRPKTKQGDYQNWKPRVERLHCD